MSRYSTVLFGVADHVATITLNRPEVLNSFDQGMLDEFGEIWRYCRVEEDVRAVVLRAAGDRAFSTGVDRKSGRFRHANPFSADDPGLFLGPKQNRVWKPLVCAVHGMCAGGAFYWLNEADVIICSEEATFFDPHTTYGMVSALESVGLSRRIPLGEALRIALFGLDERMSAQRALAIGLVSEMVPRDRAVGPGGCPGAAAGRQAAARDAGHGQGGLGRHVDVTSGGPGSAAALHANRQLRGPA